MAYWWQKNRIDARKAACDRLSNCLVTNRKSKKERCRMLLIGQLSTKKGRQQRIGKPLTTTGREGEGGVIYCFATKREEQEVTISWLLHSCNEKNKLNRMEANGLLAKGKKEQIRFQASQFFPCQQQLLGPTQYQVPAVWHYHIYSTWCLCI